MAQTYLPQYLPTLYRLPYATVTSAFEPENRAVVVALEWGPPGGGTFSGNTKPQYRATFAAIAPFDPNSTVALTGVSVTTGLGTIVLTTSNFFGLSGVSSTMSVGNLTISGWTFGLHGLSTTMDAGDLGVQASDTVADVVLRGSFSDRESLFGIFEDA